MTPNQEYSTIRLPKDIIDIFRELSEKTDYSQTKIFSDLAREIRIILDCDVLKGEDRLQYLPKAFPEMKGNTKRLVLLFMAFPKATSAIFNEDVS